VHDQLVAGVEGVHVDGEHGDGREPEAPHLLRAPQRGACHIESYENYSVAYMDPGSGAFRHLDPGSGIGKKSVSGSGTNNPDQISESLETIFGLKYSNSLMRIWIRDPQALDLSSGLRARGTDT
jgi:hypothetical protein